MPTYDYHCEACEHTLEAFQKINDEPLRSCPACKKDALKRGIGGGSATFRFLGEGFYINDCKSSAGCSPECGDKCDK